MAEMPGAGHNAGTDAGAEAGADARAGGDGRAAVRNYIRAELEKIDAEDHAPTKRAQKAAKKRRAFLTAQLKIASGEDPRRVKLDADLLRAARRSAQAKAESLPDREGDEQARRIGEAPEPSSGAMGSLRPRYWSGCVRMDFGRLRSFIDEALDGLTSARPEGDPGTWPVSEEEFSDLLQLLRRKSEEMPTIPPGLPDPGPPPLMKPFEPSLELVQVRIERDRAEKALREAGGNPDTDKRDLKALRRRHNLAGRNARSLEARERGEHDARQKEAQIYHGRARERYEASARWREAVAKEHRRIRKGRLKAAEGVAERIRRAFAPGSVADRLPWRLLPPGEISLGTLRRHYESVGARDPDLRYDMGRLEKAYSLGPSGCYTGLDEFEGYVVFTFPRTEKALLECPVYGHAIYILGSDWKRLSRLSKQELLNDAASGVTKIVHRGDWFARTKRALGLR